MNVNTLNQNKQINWLRFNVFKRPYLVIYPAEERCGGTGFRSLWPSKGGGEGA